MILMYYLQMFYTINTGMLTRYESPLISAQPYFEPSLGGSVAALIALTLVRLLCSFHRAC